ELFLIKIGLVVLNNFAIKISIKVTFIADLSYIRLVLKSFCVICLLVIDFQNSKVLWLGVGLASESDMQLLGFLCFGLVLFVLVSCEESKTQERNNVLLNPFHKKDGPPRKQNGCLATRHCSKVLQDCKGHGISKNCRKYRDCTICSYVRVNKWHCKKAVCEKQRRYLNKK
uniref:Uncharacterized protein n=1 Tax=Clytia hemisphaerica TaxID=252671 RepID=A0A7M5UL76_9CNID